MIVSISIRNWKSFRDETELSLVATEDSCQRARLTRLESLGTFLLPIAAVYGGNASGKSNFFSAINFARTQVVKGSQPAHRLPVRPFRLDEEHARRPVAFRFEILVDDVIYDFSFELTSTQIVRETLTRIGATSEFVLYDRCDNRPNFHASLQNESDLRFAFKGTRDNQLFLTNTVSQNLDVFRPVYDWFDKTLTLIAPDSRFEPFGLFPDDKHHSSTTTTDLLKQLDSGIAQLDGIKIPIDQTKFPQEIVDQLLARVGDDGVATVWSDNHSQRYIVRRENGELIATQLMTVHRGADGQEFKFEIRDESDGSKRILDLIPAFHDLLARGSAVYVIDEIDRSLHSLVTRRLIELYLDARDDGAKSQLLFTTHDINLMDQSLLRADEMWVAERDREGVSTLVAISDYAEVTGEIDVRENYLRGRFGGIPRLLLGNAWPNPLRSAVERNRW